jgi:transcriptional regulator with XRE-family HTH domain
MNARKPAPVVSPLRVFGAMLRHYRTRAGLSQDQLGGLLYCSGDTIGKIEAGQRAPSEQFTLACEAVPQLQTGGALLELRVVLADYLKQRAYPGRFHRWPEHEAHATTLRTFELVAVPGLLQTEDYARAVIAGGNGARTKEKLDHRLALRMGRQRLLEQDNPPRLWAVIDEAALRRPMGGPEVMRAQLEYLLVAADRPGITIQVMPLRYGAHAAEGGAFTILRFPEPELPDIVYLEQLTGALYLDKREDVDQYAAAMERLCADSAAPRDSLFILQKIRKEL